MRDRQTGGEWAVEKDKKLTNGAANCSEPPPPPRSRAWSRPHPFQTPSGPFRYSSPGRVKIARPVESLASRTGCASRVWAKTLLGDLNLVLSRFPRRISLPRRPSQIAKHLKSGRREDGRWWQIWRWSQLCQSKATALSSRHILDKGPMRRLA